MNEISQGEALIELGSAAQLGTLPRGRLKLNHLPDQPEGKR